MVSDPSRELRFTRAAQGRDFAVLGAIFFAVSATLFATAHWGEGSPIRYWHLIPPLLPSLAAFWLAYHCTRHACLILSPVGIEFFPLWRPSQNFRLWSWAEFHHAEVDGQKLFLHFDTEETSGAVLSLAPLTAKHRLLLERAIEGRMEERFLKTPPPKN